MTRTSTLLACVVGFLAADLARAVEPPRLTIREALATARVAFIGRVAEAREVKRKMPMTVVAEATVIPSRCLVGAVCKLKVPLKLTYRVASPQDCDVSAEFVVGRQYLFVLVDAQGKAPLVFNTCWREHGIDTAFVAASGAEILGDQEYFFQSIWQRGAKGETVSLSEIEDWARQAQRER